MNDRDGGGDRVLLLVVLVLLGIGGLAVFSSSVAVSGGTTSSKATMFIAHLTKVAVGLFLMLAFSQVDYRILKRLALPLVGASGLLLALTLIPGLPIAHSVKGATRWLDLGFLVIQPAELAKFSLVLYVASILAGGELRMSNYRRGVVPILTVLGVFSFMLIRQPNFGNVLALGIVTMVMLFVGGARVMHLLGSAASTSPIVFLIALQHPHVIRRFEGFLNPAADPLGASFQLRQSLVAFGSGGFFGLGPGAGRQSEFFLPDCHTDFVFAVLGEEFGLLGTLAVVALFAVLVWRGVRIAKSVDDAFGRHLALGVTAMIAVVAMLNMSVVLGLAPTTGLPLPFVSYGGSAMMVNLAGIGILLSIAGRGRAGHDRVGGGRVPAARVPRGRVSGGRVGRHRVRV
jgi:cell division protein FtsW